MVITNQSASNSTSDVYHNQDAGEVNSAAQKRAPSPIYMPPSEFRMRLLKRMVSAENNIDKRGLTKLQRNDSERALKATIVYPNGDVGTLISLEKINNTENKEEKESENETTLPSIGIDRSNSGNSKKYGFSSPTPRTYEKPLRLPPIILPPIYNMQPRPLMPRDFEIPPNPPKTLTDEEWDDLYECRYLRPAMKKFRGRMREVCS